MDELEQIQAATLRFEDVFASKPDVALHPFDPEKDKPVKLPGGDVATEYTGTYKDADGTFVVVPTIWYTEEGNPVYVGDRALDTARKYEAMTGNKWPRFQSVSEADAYARSRSDKGGGNSPRWGK